MMQHNSAALRVLYIGETGTISSSCVRLSPESGMSVNVVNRGNNSAARQRPDGVTWLTGDVTDDRSLLAAMTGADETTDVVLDRMVDAHHATRDVFASFAPHLVGAGR